MAQSGTTAPGAANQCFVTTHWSVVVSAASKNSPVAARALETLCGTYWTPLYTYARRVGHSPADAEDLTQGFFEQFLAHHWVARADRTRGRFRSFLLLVFKRFLANQRDRAQARKRGGQVPFTPLGLDTVETRYCREPADTSTPEEVYEKQWALTVVEGVLKGLRSEYERDGKAALFDTLKASLLGSRESQPYALLAEKLGMTEGAVKVAVCRLRERYRDRLKTEIAHTVSSPSEVDSELRHLFRALARG